MTRKTRKEKVELSDSDSNIDDHLNEDLSSSHDDGFSDDSWYGSDESADDDDGNSKAIANRTFMFPMYRGPGSVKDTVLRNVIESGEDNKLITFVRTQSIYPGRGEGARELKKKEL